MKRFTVTIPQLGTIDIESVPQGATIEWSNTEYHDGHKEGILYMHDGKSYAISEVV